MSDLKLSIGSLVVFALISLLPATSLADGAVGVGNAGKVSPANSEIKTDFHLTLTSDTKMTVSAAHITVNGGAQTNPSSTTGDGTDTINFMWNGLGVDNTDTIRWSYLVSEEEQNNVKVTSFFTPKASPTDIPSLGWRVTDNGDVYLQNAYPTAIHFDDLLFQMPGALTEAILVGLLDSPPSGETGFLSSGDVPADGQLLVGQFALSPGDFLTATADTSFVDPSFSPITEYESFGHEHQISEPAAMLVFSASFAMLMSGRARRKVRANFGSTID